MSDLVLGRSFSIPEEAVTQTMGILAVKRAGKSNAAVVMAEEMYDHDIPWVAVDPKGDWWGVRSSGDGKGAGLSVPVFGGEHADVPLEPTGGNLVADLIAAEGLTCVLDVSEMTKADQRRFLTDFAARLYKRNRDPLHVFCEEADEYIPQRVMGETAKMVGAFETLVKRGGFRGIGVTLITQRSASLNKDVLSQVGTLFMLRTTGPHDRKAIEEWIKYHDTDSRIVESLASLKNGQCWVHSPEWLGTMGPCQFRRRRTFDSGATPKLGERRKEPTRLADVNLAAIKEQMAETIERAKENDPAELKRQIKDLRGQLDTANAQLAVPPVDKIEYVVPPKLVEVATAMLDAASGHASEMKDLAGELTAELDRLVKEELEKGSTVSVREITDARLESFGPIDRPTSNTAGKMTVHRTPERTGKGSFTGPPRSEPQTRGQKVSPRVDTSVNSLSGAPAKILQVIAQNLDRAITPRRAGFLAGYSSRKSTVRNAMSTLRQAGYITGEGAFVFITDAGLAAVGPIEPLPTGEELKVHWLQEIGPNSAPGRILLVMLEGSPLDRIWTPMQLADATGITPGTSTLRNAMSKLRQLGLVTGNHLDPDFVEAIR